MVSQSLISCKRFQNFNVSSLYQCNEWVIEWHFYLQNCPTFYQVFHTRVIYICWPPVRHTTELGFKILTRDLLIGLNSHYFFWTEITCICQAWEAKTTPSFWYLLYSDTFEVSMIWVSPQRLKVIAFSIERALSHWIYVKHLNPDVSLSPCWNWKEQKVLRSNGKCGIHDYLEFLSNNMTSKMNTENIWSW